MKTEPGSVVPTGCRREKVGSKEICRLFEGKKGWPYVDPHNFYMTCTVSLTMDFEKPDMPVVTCQFHSEEL